MRVLLTSAGLETEEIKECFVDMAGKDMSNRSFAKVYERPAKMRYLK